MNRLMSYFDDFGEYRHRINVQHLAYFERQNSDNFEDTLDQLILQVNKQLNWNQ